MKESIEQITPTNDLVQFQASFDALTGDVITSYTSAQELSQTSKNALNDIGKSVINAFEKLDNSLSQSLNSIETQKNQLQSDLSNGINVSSNQKHLERVLRSEAAITKSVSEVKKFRPFVMKGNIGSNYLKHYYDGNSVRDSINKAVDDAAYSMARATVLFSASRFGAATAARIGLGPIARFTSGATSRQLAVYHVADSLTPTQQTQVTQWEAALQQTLLDGTHPDGASVLDDTGQVTDYTLHDASLLSPLASLYDTTIDGLFDFPGNLALFNQLFDLPDGRRLALTHPSLKMFLPYAPNNDQYTENLATRLPWPTRNTNTDPLVFSLSPTPARFYGLATSNTFFDIDADGQLERVGWPEGPNMPFLALDRNNNGEIDSVREVFGDPDQTGIEELSKFDNNNDKWITLADPIFPSLLFWDDKNKNGRSESTELRPITDYQIKNISLTIDKRNRIENGNIIDGEGPFFYSNGTQGVFTEVHFGTAQHNFKLSGNATDTGIVTFDNAFGPYLRRYGTLKSLPMARTVDDNLDKVIEKLINITPEDYIFIPTLIEEAIFRWAEVYERPMTEHSNAVIDFRKVHTLWRILDGPIPNMFDTIENFSGLSSRQAELLRQVWVTFEREISAQILAQATFSRILGEIKYDIALDQLVLPNSAKNYTSAFQSVENFIKPFANETSIAVPYLNEFDLTMQTLFANQFNITSTTIHAAGIRIINSTVGIDTSPFTSIVYAVPGGKINDILKDKVWGFDLVIGSQYGDRINVREADYVIYAGKGQDTVQNDGAGDPRDNSFHSVIYGGEDNDNLIALTGHNTLIGGPGDDLLTGGFHEDILIGGPGDDRIHGNRGNDTYVYKSFPFGHDSIRDSFDYDTIKFEFSEVTINGKNISINSNTIAIDRDKTPDLIIYIRGYRSSSSITIKEHYSLPYYRKIEEIVFASGEKRLLDVNQWITYGTPENDNLIVDGEVYALAGDDIVTGADRGNIIYLGEGNDQCYAGRADNLICGEEGNDNIRCNWGVDFLDGGPGNDLLDGDQSRDYYIFSEANFGHDLISDGWGPHTIKFTFSDYTVNNQLKNLSIDSLSFSRTDDGRLKINIIGLENTCSITVVRGYPNLMQFADGATYKIDNIDNITRVEHDLINPPRSCLNKTIPWPPTTATPTTTPPTIAPTTVTNTEIPTTPTPTLAPTPIETVSPTTVDPTVNPTTPDTTTPPATVVPTPSATIAPSVTLPTSSASKAIPFPVFQQTKGIISWAYSKVNSLYCSIGTWWNSELSVADIALSVIPKENAISNQESEAYLIEIYQERDELINLKVNEKLPGLFEDFEFLVKTFKEDIKLNRNKIYDAKRILSFANELKQEIAINFDNARLPALAKSVDKKVKLFSSYSNYCHNIENHASLTCSNSQISKLNALK